MKNIIRLSIFMLAISIVFTACNKETSLTEVKDIDHTEQRILDFKDKMQNANKSGETMSIEDAVWYIEAALNYTYCNTPEVVPEVDLFNIETFYVNTEAVEEQISLSNVIDAYNTIEDNMLTNFENFNGINKFLSVVDIEFENNTFGSKVYTEYKAQENKSLITGWIWGLKLGSCDGQYQNVRDASTEIYKYLKSTYPVSAMRPGYWTDILTPYRDGYNGYVLYQNNGPWYGTEQNPFLNSNLIIYQENTDNNNWDRCLTIGDTYDWFKARAWTAVQGAKGYQDDLYDSYGMYDHQMKSYFFTNRKYWAGTTECQSHRVEFTYGIFHVGAPIH